MDNDIGNVLITFEKYTSKTVFQGEQVINISQEDLKRLQASKSAEEWKIQLIHLKSEGYMPKLILVDVGLTSTLNENSKQNFIDVVQAALQFDGYSIANLLIERSTHPELVINAERGE